MADFAFRFFALSKSTSFFKLSSSKEETIHEFQFNFLAIFMSNVDFEKQKADIQNPQQNTQDIREKVNDFVRHYSVAEPRIHQLNEYFKQLKENERFFIYLGDSITQETNDLIFDLLMSMELNKPYEEFKKEKDGLLKEVIENYHVISVDENTSRSIGERDKNKRICRFCGEKKPKVSFKTEAHAISESLGNKNIILNEECDDCNNKFGKGIEQEFTDYLSLFRGFYSIKGKNGVPKIKGKNFEITDTGFTIKHKGSDEEIESSSPPTKVPVYTYFNLAKQSVYKTLVKFALSVIDSKYMNDFEETIKWINGEKNVETLPKIAVLTSNLHFNDKPKMTVYIRKTNDEKIPYTVGEFHFTALVFVFIIPFSNGDTNDFLNQDAYSNYWNFFKHFHSFKEWVFQDFSDNVTREFHMNLNLQIGKTNK